MKSAREVWGVVLEAMTVDSRTVYALSFQRKGSSVFFLYRHYSSREEAETDHHQISRDLLHSSAEFERKYSLERLG